MENFNCLAPNEEIFVNNGEYKAIEDVVEGDTVLSADGEYHKVSKVYKFEKPTYYFTLNDGQHIECSNTHRFLVNKSKINKPIGWKTAEELHDGDEIFGIDVIKSFLPDSGMKFIRYKVVRKFASGTNTVYDLTVEDSHNYISANGVINHNCN